MKRQPRCRWAKRPVKYVFDGVLGMRLMETGVFGCSLALKDCNGKKDPGCGHYEPAAPMTAGTPA